MNKYLLLRDNKQSGPYTTGELIALGIKPYDLVWLDGKSAAWRYPSEIDELKVYAPVVEEQPYDRFFTKDKQQKTPVTGQAAATPRAAPGLSKQGAAPGAKPSNTKPSHTIYVELPLHAAVRQSNPIGSSHEIPDRQSIAEEHRNEDTNQQSIAEERRNEDTNRQSIAEEHRNEIPDQPPVPVRSTADFLPQQPTEAFAFTPAAPTPPVGSRHLFAGQRLSRAAIIAGFAMLLVVSFLIVNYRSERHRIAELQLIMQQLEAEEERPLQDYAAFSQPVSSVPEADAPHTFTAPAAASVNRHQATGASAGNISAAGSSPRNDLTNNSTIRPAANTGNAPAPQPAAASGATVSGEASGSGISGTTVSNEANRSGISGAAAAEPKATDGQSGGENLYELVEVRTNEYKTGILGGISDLRLELNNRSQQALERVFVELRYLGPEKRVVRTQTVYFEHVAPGARSVLKVPKSSRGVTVDYTVTNIKS